jgi:hypothetical protein
MDAAQRLQELNEAAYYDVLRAFIARGCDQAVLAMKLRKELNVSNLQHRAWFEELRSLTAAGGPTALE